MITAFGKFLRNLRMDNGELLKTMAEKLKVTSSFLSAVENGKKNIPEDWVSRISVLYSLPADKQVELQNAYSETKQCIEIGLNGLNNQSKELAFSFARKLNSFSDEELKKILEIIRGKENNQ